MKKFALGFLISFVLFSCSSNFSNDDILGEWHYENGFDINSKDSIYYEKNTVKFLENGKYMYMKNKEWVSLNSTHWEVKGDLFLMGDGRAGTIVDGSVIKDDNARWQAKIVNKDTIQGWFEVYTPPLKTNFILIRKQINK